MSDNLYQKLSAERKAMQATGDMPEHWTTGSWQLFKSKYLYQASTPREQYQRIARTLAVHTKDPEYYSDRFFDIMWKGWLSPSTPVLANTGTTRGLPVSCAGTYVDDSIFGIYHNKLEVAMLTKHGFGTASYLGDVRSRGSDIFGGGKSSGILPIFQGFQMDMEYVAQGTARRGSWAGYIPIDHGDFDEVIHYLEANPDGNNIGWNLSAAFIERLENRDPEALRRYAQAMVTKMKTGKGYFFFPDKANAKRPKWYVDHGLDIKAAQLCLTGDTLVVISTSEDDSLTASVRLDTVCKRFNQGYKIRVQSRDANGVVRYSPITAAAQTGTVTELIEVTCGSGSIRCTPDHQVFTKNRGWVKAKDLVPTDRLVHSASEATSPLEITHVDTDPTPVYDITVPDTQNFFANDILVHNCNEITLHSSSEYTYTCVLASPAEAKIRAL